MQVFEIVWLFPQRKMSKVIQNKSLKNIITTGKLIINNLNVSKTTFSKSILLEKSKSL